jgi:uncharacterized protein (TIGR02996 family)
MRTFEFNDARSHKFWTIDVRGNGFNVTYGKVGTAGQSQTKTFSSPEQARAAADRLIRGKLAKRYIETTPPVPTAQAVAFERALADNPDDLAGWSAYADYLTEQGSPRGEFMQVQLALEDESLSAAERKKLRSREKELLEKHEREWLGNLAPYLLDRVPHDPPSNDYDPALLLTSALEYRWRRGFLGALTAHGLSTTQTHALADSPEVRFVREFRVHETLVNYGGDHPSGQPPFRVPTPQGVRRHWELLELIGTPFLRNLRVLQVGGEVPEEDGWCDCHTYANGLEHVVADMRRVEELYLYCKDYNIERLFALPNLSHLRVLFLYHFGERGDRRGGPGYEYPLNLLANNRALGNLTHLLFHPHYRECYPDPPSSFLPLTQVRLVLRSKHLTSLTHLQLRLSDMGDDGVREIIASGILNRLKVLDLRHGCITDEGARLFAACPDTRNLDKLDLSRNAVTSAGLSALRKAAVNAVANKPQTQAELTKRQYLFEGDFE